MYIYTYTYIYIYINIPIYKHIYILMSRKNLLKFWQS